MRKRSRVALFALLAVLALLAAACGDSDSTETTAGTTAAPQTTAAATATTAAAVETTAAPTETTEAMSTEPIKIGMLADQTSTFTPWAVNVRDGMLLAAEEINAAGGVNGRMIEIVNEDSENDAEVGVTGLERLVEDNVVAIGGILSSTVGAAVSPVAEELQMPTFLVKSGTPAAGSAFRRCACAAVCPRAGSDQRRRDRRRLRLGPRVQGCGGGYFRRFRC
jgi:ABC-type branched-subunit amino acid transport system substrate-binding protein